MDNNGVRLQNLRDFTVQIRHTTTDQTVGTGVVVSTDGKILTCAHVVLAAGVNPRLRFRIPSTWKFIIENILGQNSDLWLMMKMPRLVFIFPRRGATSAKPFGPKLWPAAPSMMMTLCCCNWLTIRLRWAQSKLLCWARLILRKEIRSVVLVSARLRNIRPHERTEKYWVRFRPPLPNNSRPIQCN